MKTIDIITPVRNEEKNIPIFVDDVLSLHIPESVKLRIIFIEDSSTDNTLEELRKLSIKYRNIKYYALKKGFGQGPAIVFGMKCSNADAVITMDVDGCHPIEVIPEMINYYLNGVDVVQAVRLTFNNRKLYRKIGTLIFNIITRLLTGINVNEQNVYFRLVSREYKNMIVQNKKLIYFVRIDLSQITSHRVQKVYFNSANRKFGKSKYNLFRLLKLSLDGLLSNISVFRLTIIIFFFFALGIISILFAEPYLLIFFSLIIALIMLRYYQISHNNILNLLEIKEKN